MRFGSGLAGMALVTALAAGLPSVVLAADIMCKTSTNNHMLVSDAYVSSCIEAGVGNIGQGNQANDDWLNQLPANHGYTTIDDQSFTQSGLTGTFTIDASQWNNFGQLFVGFKFGTGGNPDEWFIYQLNTNVSSGSWNFVKLFQQGGGLSHVSLYGKGKPGEEEAVPEPASLALLGIGALAAGVARRRRKQA